MKNYDLNLRNAEHTMKITLQSDDYKGYVFVKCGGNCKGAEMINFATEYFETCDTEDVKALENDCNLEFDEDAEYFACRLKNADGDELIIEDDYEDFINMIVAVEIIEQVAK